MAEEAEARARFLADNEVRRAQDPDFEGSTWDHEWDDLQPYCQNLYLYGNGCGRST